MSHASSRNLRTVADDSEYGRYASLVPKAAATPTPAPSDYGRYADLVPHASPQVAASSAYGRYADLVPKHDAKKLEVAKGPDKKPKPANPLRNIGDFLELGIALPNAWVRDDPKLADDLRARGHHTEFAKALSQLTSGKLHEVADEYGAGTQPQLANEASRGNRLAQARLDHPLINTGVTFAEEWGNPASALAGGGLGALMRFGVKPAVAAARASSPVLADSLDAIGGAASDVARPFQRASQAIRGGVTNAVQKIPGVNATAQAGRHLFSRYAGLRDRGGTPYVAAGVATQSAPARAQVEVIKDTRDRWGGLTRAQKLEVQRLSYVDQNGAPLAQRNPVVPDPRSGGSLADRAQNVRADLRRDDADQAALGIRDATRGELFDSGRFFPMRKFGSRPVYATPELDALAETNGEQALTRAAGLGRSLFSAGVSKGQSKRYPTILEPGVEAKLHPEQYDPAHQYQQHRIESRVAIANEQARRGLESVQGVDGKGNPLTVTRDGASAPAYARMPSHFVAAPRGRDEIGLGFGTEGRANAERYQHQVAALMARSQAKQDPAVVQAAETRGIPPALLGTRKVTARDPRPFEAKVQQARGAFDRIGTASARAEKAAQGAASAQSAQIQQLAGTLDKAQRTLLLGNDVLSEAVRSNDVLLGALHSNVAGLKEAGRGILDDLAVTENRFVGTGNKDFDAYLFSEAKRRATFPAYVERYMDVENAAGDYERTVRTSGNASRAAGYEDSLFTPADVTAARKAAKEAGLNLSVKQTDELLHRAHGFMTDRDQQLRDVLDRYATSGPEAAPMLRAELKRTLADLSGWQAHTGGAEEASRPFTAAARRARESAELAGGRVQEAAKALRAGAVDANTGASIAPFRTLKAKQGAELDRLKQQAATARSSSDLQSIYRLAFDKAYAQIKPEVERTVEARAPKGYVREADLGLASPTGRDMALDKPFAEFLKDHSVDRATLDNPDARGFWAAMQTVNRISRAGIVAIPVVHAVNNLGTHYLASGGDVPTMLRILGGKYEANPEVLARAQAAGAVNPFAVGAFAGSRDAHSITTAAGELAGELGAKAGPLSAPATGAARLGIEADRRVYEPMNRWLFDTVEQGYAADLFGRLTTGDHAVSDGEAAIAVRNALGKYGDVSAGEQRAMLNRLLYFFPWSKTVIPFWIKHGMIDPKWIDAPVRAIEQNNKQQGYDDPARPFTATLGRRSDGSYRRYVVPLPQRVAEMIAQGARTLPDVLRGDWESAGSDAAAPVDYLRGHLNAVAAVGADALDFANARKVGKNAAPWNVFRTDPNGTPLQRGATVAGNIVGRSFSPFQQIARIRQDPAMAGFSTVFGGFPYGAKPEALTAREHAVRTAFSRLKADATKAHAAPGVLQRLNDQESAALQRVDNAYLRALATRQPATER